MHNTHWDYRQTTLHITTLLQSWINIGSGWSSFERNSEQVKQPRNQWFLNRTERTQRPTSGCDVCYCNSLTLMLPCGFTSESRGDRRPANTHIHLSGSGWFQPGPNPAKRRFLSFLHDLCGTVGEERDAVRRNKPTVITVWDSVAWVQSRGVCSPSQPLYSPFLNLTEDQRKCFPHGGGADHNPHDQMSLPDAGTSQTASLSRPTSGPHPAPLWCCLGYQQKMDSHIWFIPVTHTAVRIKQQRCTRLTEENIACFWDMN